MALCAIASAAIPAPAGAQHNGSSGAPAAAPRTPRAVQGPRAVQLLPGLQLGGVLPTGELGDVYSTGIRAGATLTAIVPTQPYGVRAAVTYDRLGGGTISPSAGTVLDVEAASMLSLTINGLYSERAQRSALLYFTAGLGAHRLDAQDTDELDPGDDEPTDDPDDPPSDGAGAETKFGASVGGGLTFRIGGLPSYLEVKVVKLFGADAVLVPVVFGIQFGR